jgi:hypothetical protein
MKTATRNTAGLSRFESAAQFFHMLAILDDHRLLPIVGIMHKMHSAYQKVTCDICSLPLISELRRLGILDATLHLSPIGVAIWNELRG